MCRRFRCLRGKEERLQGTTEGRSSSPRLVSSSAVLFPGRNEYLGTNCSLIIKEERKTFNIKRVNEFEVERKTEEMKVC